ncbi:MAG: FAD-binding oxidoreductase [Bacteroidota bacterium]
MSSKCILIVGGGLAGTFLAARLCLAGQTVHLVDDQAPNSASRVAAGLFNVITGRFGAKSWQADLLLQEIKDFFTLEPWADLQALLHYVPIYRPFREAGDYNKWSSRSIDPQFAHLVQFDPQPRWADRVHNNLGGIEIQPCGWAETGKLLEQLQSRLIEHFGLKRHVAHFSYQELEVDPKIWKGPEGPQQFDQIVFAEGYRMTQNPWLASIEIRPNKGETLLLHIPELKLDSVLSRKVYLIPQGKDRYLCGSTYRNQFETADPTAAGREEILTHLEKAIKVPYTVLDHWAGVRPTTPNRRPILGVHPDWPNVFILGGFGTKGMLLGPWSSRLLTQLMLEGIDAIPEAAHVRRFF